MRQLLPCSSPVVESEAAVKHTRCKQQSCTGTPFKGGWCIYHYEKRESVGLTRRVPADPVIAHVRQLRTLGWTHKRIAAVSGVSISQQRHMINGKYKTTIRDVASRLLAVPLTPQSSKWEMVDTPGVRRRLQALAVMGWPQRMVCARAGVGSNIGTLHRGHITAVTFGKIAAVYEELWNVPGPSKQAATMARNAGFAAPMDWDDIDDPCEVPSEPVPAGEDVDEVLLARFLKGRATHHALNHAEKLELARRLIASGHTTYRASIVSHIGLPRLERELAA